MRRSLSTTSATTRSRRRWSPPSRITELRQAGFAGQRFQVADTADRRPYAA
jgi:hypothetical protein